MHSSIIELTLNPLDREDWAGEDCFYDDEKIDYVSELDDEERRDSIHDWQDGSDAVFSQLFTPGDDDTVIFKGKDALMKVYKEWINSIKSEVDGIVESESFSPYRVIHAVNRVLHSDYLFCLPDWAEYSAVYPNELLSFLSNLEDGAILHIGAVIDYHY